MRRPVGVKSILFCWTRCFLQPSRHCRHPSIRTLDERLSLGASWAFSFQPVLPPDCRPVFLFAEKLGQAINAVTGTRLVDLIFPFSECFCFYAAAGMVMRPLLCNGSYTSPLTHK